MKKILIIDEDTKVLENVSDILRLANYKVIITKYGRDGINLALKERPDTIICCIDMPGMNGYEVLYLMGKNPITAIIPFIFLTSRKNLSELRKGLSMGADDFLFKPFNKMELLTSIETRLKKSDQLLKSFNRPLEDFEEFIASLNGIEELKKLSFERKVRKMNGKEYIYMEGDEAQHIYFIRKGMVKTFTTDESGKEFITGLNPEGSFIGPLDLLESDVYRESAIATEESEIISIPKKKFFSLIASNNDVAVRFIHVLSNNVYEMHQRLLRLAYGSVRRRMADALLSLPKKSEKGSLITKFNISREDLASIAGISRESVSRVLHEFKDEKLIDFIGNQNKQITILRENELIKMKN